MHPLMGKEKSFFNKQIFIREKLNKNEEILLKCLQNEAKMYYLCNPFV